MCVCVLEKEREGKRKCAHWHHGVYRSLICSTDRGHLERQPPATYYHTRAPTDSMKSTLNLSLTLIRAISHM